MRVVIEADRALDGTGGVTQKAALLVEGDRIAGLARQADMGRPDGAHVVTAPPGATLMPGLIDAHVHLAWSGSADPRQVRAEKMDQSFPEVALRAAARARDSLIHGMTALRDMAAPGGIAIDLAAAIAAGHILGPRVVACGRGLTVTGGHMDRPTPDHIGMTGARAPCDGADGFRKGVRTEARRGADFIKINACVSAHKRPGVWYRPEMTPEEIRAACDEAHVQGMTVASHTSGGPPLTATVANGVDCVEHAHWIDDDCIALMVERGTFLVPTLLVNERTFELAPEGARISPWSVAAREAKWVSLAKARAAGIRVGAGTDAGFMLPHATMFWRELQLLVQGGYSALDAITCATSVNADILGIEAGRLAPGRLADLVVVDGDPAGDVAILGDPRRLSVWKGGVQVTKAGQLLTPWPEGVAA
ncbi:MAG: amidohydrolase family protein [Rhodobacteraceae bacterium]|jgi:imidazolonepropionase-like amidohydrolase|nr:amidohydrolase family protein [Paracoccaceae bacterium]